MVVSVIGSGPDGESGPLADGVAGRSGLAGVVSSDAQTPSAVSVMGSAPDG